MGTIAVAMMELLIGLRAEPTYSGVVNGHAKEWPLTSPAGSPPRVTAVLICRRR